MQDAQLVLDALRPVILLLFLGVVTAIASRSLRLSPIVGYLVLGVALHASGRMLGLDLGTDRPVIHLLSELGVVFLMFDIGLHFSFAQIRVQARDIFGFGPVQVVLGTVGLGLVCSAFGMSPLAAAVAGATLALSSTAVVARLIAERHQQNCPVGLTATAILIFQDVAAIFLLIVASSLAEPGSILATSGAALIKAVLAFGVAAVLGRFVVRPVFDLIARAGHEEVFTGSALLIALATGWATGSVGLSLTLGAFLGGTVIAETPFRAVVHSEIKAFRGLLLGFFFISVGLSLDIATLSQAWPAIVLATLLLLIVKVITNGIASLVFRWSVPGSVQLGFLLAQGSEFAFVILSLPAVRALLGDAAAAALIAAVALSLALTPALAQGGRAIAGRLRRRAALGKDAELVPRVVAEPVLIAGMGAAGRTLADALNEFDVGYAAIERDESRLQHAIADGYHASFGDFSDPRIWEPLELEGRRITAHTAPVFEVSRELVGAARLRYPDLKRVALVKDEHEAEQFRSLGVLPVIDRSVPRGLDLAAAVLHELGVDAPQIGVWMARQQNRALAASAIAA